MARIVRWVDGKMEGQRDRQIDGQTNRQTERWTDGQTYQWSDEQKYRQTLGQMKKLQMDSHLPFISRTLLLLKINIQALG